MLIIKQILSPTLMMTSNDNIYNLAIQMARYKLLQFCSKVAAVSNCEYYDYLVSTSNSDSRFAVKVYPDDIDCANEIAILYDKVKDQSNNNSQINIPIVLLYVNTTTASTKFQKMLTWNYNNRKAHDYRYEPKLNWNSKNATILFAEIDKAIVPLPNSMWSFKKVITIHSDLYLDAYIVYFRRITDSYRIQEKNCKSETESLSRLIKGIPETEWPSDKLDKAIIAAIDKEYPGCTIHSSSFIFNTELKDIQYYNRLNVVNGSVILIPSSGEFDKFLTIQVNGILPQIPLTIVYQPHLFKNPDTVICQRFSVECSVDEMGEIENLKDTYVPLEKYLMK